MRNALRSDELQSVVGSTLKPDEIRMKWFMNLIDYQDARPIYEQICDGYKALILKKVMLPNDPMPSVRSLAVDLRRYAVLPWICRQIPTPCRGLSRNSNGRDSFIR